MTTTREPIPFDRRPYNYQKGTSQVDRLAAATHRMEQAMIFMSRWNGRIKVSQDQAGRICFVDRHTGVVIRHPVGIKPELLLLVCQAEGMAPLINRGVQAPPTRAGGVA